MGVIGAGSSPALAQTMPDQGIPLPFFRSRAQEFARGACRENRPGYRSSVRAQMELECTITVIVPWAAVGVAILGVLFWLRAQEKKKEKHRIRARRHHDPSTCRNLDKTQADRHREASDDDGP